MNSTAAKIQGQHCGTCGQPAEATAGNQGYSDCCNDRICDGLHADAYAIGTWDFATDERTETGTARGCCAPAVEKATGKRALYRR